MSTPIHEYRKKAALKAIEDLFSDTSVGPDETAASLHELRDEINDKLNTLASEE